MYSTYGLLCQSSLFCSKYITNKEADEVKFDQVKLR